MVPRRSSSANDIRIVLVEGDAHFPSVVPRTVTATGAAPRLAFTKERQDMGSTTSSQPPDGDGGWPLSIVCVAHLVMMRQSVTVFLKSTSNAVKGAPKGVHCTEMTFMFGGTSTVSGG